MNDQAVATVIRIRNRIVIESTHIFNPEEYTNDVQTPEAAAESDAEQYYDAPDDLIEEDGANIVSTSTVLNADGSEGQTFTYTGV